MALFFRDAGFSTSSAIQGYAASVVLGVVAKLGIGLVADRWPARAALLFDFAVVALASLLLLGIPAPGMRPAFIASHGIATAAQNVVYPLVVAHCFGVRQMAPIYGALMLALLPGGILGPLFAGYLHDAFGSYAIPFRIFAGLNAVSLLALCAVRVERRRGA
jgi:MFS family permease